MREVHLFPAHARHSEVQTTARTAIGLDRAEGDRFVRGVAERHADRIRTFGDDESVIAADAAGFERAVGDEMHRLRVQAVIDDPEELAAARDIARALAVFGRGTR